MKLPVVSPATTIKNNKMKKIFTLASALLLSVAMFAADRRPSVTVTSSKKYQIVIDGKSYLGSNGNAISISNIQSGFHTVKVFEVNRFFFKRNKKMVSTSSFQVRNQDVMIDVNRFGQLQITQSSFGRDYDGNGWNKKDDHRFGNRDDHQGQGKNGHGNRF
jgi:hypothetical protein